MPPDLCGDAGRLRQVLLNLLSNAVKFTEKGEVALYVRTENVSPPARACCFSRSSIRASACRRRRRRAIFQPFAQADGSTTRKYGGTGLGLAISRGLVERMDGQMGVRKASRARVRRSGSRPAVPEAGRNRPAVRAGKRRKA